MDPIVSIVLPVYNVAPFLKECVQSIINQSYPKESMEIIAINDGSTDESLDILKSHQDKLPAMRIIDQENKGLGATRNIGMGLAQGDYIYFLDSDDWIDPNLVTDCVKKMEEDSLEVCYFQKYIFNISKSSEKKPKPILFQTRNQNFGIQTGMDFLSRELDLSESCASVCQYFYRTSFLRKHDFSFPEIIFHEDEPFTVRILLLAERFANLEKAYFIRRIRHGSIMTSTPRLERAENYRNALRVMHSYYPELNPEQTELLSRYMVVILRVILNFHRADELWKRRSFLWSAAKMIKSRPFHNVPDFLGDLYMFIFCIYRSTRRFLGKKLRRLGSRLENI